MYKFSMVKNRTMQLVYQTVYCTVGFIGVVASFDFFDMDFFGEVYIYFTNWSNYFCLIVVFVELVNLINSEEKYLEPPIRLLKFIGAVSIIITFFAYNFPDPSRNPAWNYKINSIAFHIVLPIMYIVDWFLFYEKRKIKWIYPVYAAVFPAIYVFFMFTRAWLLNFNSIENNLYPYFFLDIDKIGVGGAINLCFLLILLYMIIGFIFVGFDCLIRFKCKKT